MNNKKPLPKLLKLENALKYSVGVDNIIDTKNGKEVFVFCVAAFFEDEVHFIQTSTIVNEFSGKSESPFNIYLKELSHHYNCIVLYETD